jgi:hypothetical protein
VTETADSGRVARRNRLLLVGGCVLLFLIGLVAGFMYRGVIDYRDMIDSTQLVVQTRSENQELTTQLAEEGAKRAALQAKLKNVQDLLDLIVPAKNTYNIGPNQSLSVADGRLTIGLVGSPANEGINVNINGQQHAAAAGDIIHITLNPSTTCQVEVHSFDMFKAVLAASCGSAKPQ